MSKHSNHFLRHTLATIAYRFQKSLTHAGSDFGEFKMGESSRSPKEIVFHMHEVLKAARIFVQTQKLENEKNQALIFNQEIARFQSELENMDKALSENELPMEYSNKIVQGPLADILTHIGQMAMLSGLNGHPLPAEDFSRADIKSGTLSYF